MKKTTIRFIATTLVASSLFLTACGAKSSKIPYSELGLNATLEEVTALEGANYETYPSIYEGTTYTYEKEYKGRAGKVKYMFNGEDALMNIAWLYSADSTDAADILYKEIYSDLQKEYGAPSDTAGVNNYGAVWKRAEGNIILSAIVSSEANVVQVAYLDPEVSKE